LLCAHAETGELCQETSDFTSNFNSLDQLFGRVDWKFQISPKGDDLTIDGSKVKYQDSEFMIGREIMK